MRKFSVKRYVGVFLAIALSLSVIGCGKVKETAPETAEEVTTEASANEVVTSKEETSEESNKEASTAEKKEDTKAVESESKEKTEVKTEEKTEEKTEAKAEEKTDAAAEKASSEKEVKEVQKEESKEESKEATTEATAPTEPKQPEGYGRILFCGDSRTVDMFSGEADEFRNLVSDGIAVYCKNGCQFEYMVDAVNEYGMDNFDTLVSWMGCNNFGDFSKYGPYYDQILASGKKLVICTVGPTVDECLLIDQDYLYYPNSNQINYNNSLVSWANGKDVMLIDMYSYIDNSMKNGGGVSIDPNDGIHYLPQPTTELWNYIIGFLK